jgi:hypothetical protein
MKRILHNHIRLADKVVKLDPFSASAYRRVRTNNFKLNAVFSIENDSSVNVVRRAVESLGDHSVVDILIDDKLSLLQVSRKKSGIGWSITENNDLIEVVVNDLFASHAITLCIESTVVSESAELLGQSGVQKGRIFYACPSRNFRYSVYCPLGDVHSTQDVLQQTQVCFSTSLPQFIDDFAPQSSSASIDIASTPAIDDVQAIPSVASARMGKTDEALFDVTLTVLLDEKVDTTIAAAAFLAREASDADLVVEIGLWRRRFKSAFSRFFDVSKIFELERLPMSSRDLQEVSGFIEGLCRGSAVTHSFIVIGEEMMDVASVQDFSDILAVSSSRLRVAVFSQSDLALSARRSGVSHFADRSLECLIVMGGDSMMDVSELLGKQVTVRRFYLPPYLKQAVLLADKNGVAAEKVRKVAHQILQG